ncbi:MAG TPA: CocE/NonD family hydrolase [Acidimicrobiales bacterium]
MPIRRVLVAALACPLFLLAACSSDDSASPGAEAVSLDGAATLDVTLRPGVESVMVEDAAPGTDLRLVDADGQAVDAWFAPLGTEAASGTVDDEGLLAFGRVPPGEGYRVVAGDGDELQASEPITVLARDEAPPSSLFEGQELVEGINYLEMRDGTTLAAMVRFPSFPRDDVPADGPYPTVVNMSGYSPADPSSPPPELQLADALGYATVGVNLRGTGCSGGALSFFEGSQVADGYDAIEAIAAQDWVAGNEVGMVGISYPGITQLFVASTQPPHLAAISPMSVIDDPYAGVGYPGGIFNSGFAAEWTSHVSDDAAAYGPDYVNQQIDDGDTDCDGNQALRSQNLDLVAGLEAEPFDDADRFGPIRPAELVDQIDVPVFLTGQWQDEQTSGHFADMLDRFTGTDRLHAYMTNGPHGDGLTLPNFQRWADFLDLYVAHRIPALPAVARAGVPSAVNAIFGEGVGLGPDRFAGYDSYEEALADWEADDPFTVVFENGAATDNPGGPGGTTEATFASWPPPDAEATTWYLQPDGTLGADEPTVADGEDGSVVEYAQVPAQARRRTLAEQSDDVSFSPQPPYRWPSPQQGEVATWLTPPLEDDLAVVGSARADVYLQSSAPDTDLEVTLTEVTPAGDEVYVQTGWLRASHRALDEERSTPIHPVPLHTETAAEPLPEGEFVEVSVDIFPFAHLFRAGSRLRLSIDTPGGNRARWAFDTVDTAGQSNLIADSSDFPSSLTLAVVDGVQVPRARPACGTLRAQPCRPYEPVDNVPGS